MRRSLTRLVAPSTPLISLAEAYLQLRLDTEGSPPTSPEDDWITAAIAAETERLDAGTGFLGRALAPQTWRVGLDGWYWLPELCTWGAKLPYPPLIEVTSVTYTDPQGDAQSAVEGVDFRVVNQGAEGHGYVVATFNGQLPTVRTDFDSILITFRAGYVTGSPEVLAVPESVKSYLRAALTFLYDTRGVVAPGNQHEVPPWIRNMLENVRVRT